VDLQPFHAKTPHRLLWANLRAARGKVPIGHIQLPNYCIILTVYTKFSNVAAGRMRLSGRGLDTHDVAEDEYGTSVESYWRGKIEVLKKNLLHSTTYLTRTRLGSKPRYRAHM